MTESQRAVVARLSGDCAAISAYLARMSADLVTLDRLLAQQPEPAPPQWFRPPAPAARPAPLPQPQARPGDPAVRANRPEGWIGKALAAAGVAVTLIGVVLLLVLAAQAGILHPGFRVAAGAVLAGGLVGAGRRLYRRPGGRIGAIALAATGIAAAYMDVIAVTAIYHWVSAPVGLAAAAVIGGGGLMLARRWGSEHLGLLVLVPMIGLAPVVTDGVTLLLIGFMLALSAASLPVQYGRDWVWMHTARIAASTCPLLLALAATAIGGREDLRLATVCALAAVLAVASGLVLLAWTGKPAVLALQTAVGVVPLLCVSAATDRVVAALMIAALAAALLAVVAVGDRLPGMVPAVRQGWSALSALAAMLAVIVAFDGSVAGPVLSGMAIVVAVAGRHQAVARCSALGFAVLGGCFFLAYAPPRQLARAVELPTATAISVLVAGVVLVGAAVAIAWSWTGSPPADVDLTRIVWAAAGTVSGYALTMCTVTAGVVIGGPGAGFFGGHMVATICWIVVAAGLFRYAAGRSRTRRSLPLGAGLALVAAAMAKLFLFDLGTLDGIFRVVVFIVVGVVLLTMGAGYARLLAQQGQRERLDGHTPV
ncbi:DUF2339 domain-containing protein [Mycobacterium sp. NPDC003449]